jgi:hypothetical protein
VTSPKPTDYVLQVAGAPYAVIAMERTATSDIVVTVRAGASPWLGAGAYTATLRRKDHSAAWYETGLQFARIHDENLFRQKDWHNWADYCQLRWSRDVSGVDKQIASAKQMDEMRKIFGISETLLPSAMSQATELAKLKTGEDRGIVWLRVLDTANGSGITAVTVKGAVEKYLAEKSKTWITLEEWDLLAPDEQTQVLIQAYSAHQFNKQDSDNIEWARWSWNPVTGCLHDCPYCYARDIADRFYPQGFTPTLHPDRLSNPRNAHRIATDIWSAGALGNEPGRRT